MKKTTTAAKNLLNKDETSLLFIYAAYIIEKCGDVTPLQLQKMLYYTQACFIIFYNKFAFSDECEAWVHGPVYRSVYEKYKDYKYESITQKSKLPELKSEEEVILNLVIDNFGRYSGKILEEFTHKELPWLKASEVTEMSVYIPNNVIKKNHFIKKRFDTFYIIHSQGFAAVY